ncbi:MAG TPA: TIGR04222 domain-containing membrane protein [Opitutaceae bacterium]
MNPDQRTLWQRIQAHVLDDPQSASPFSLRLAAENGWKPGFTQRAIEEYRRFAFLATAAGHPVSPSDAVDQVWHLHLLYTRDYWGEFCPRVLGAPLHHGPARGGIAEKEKLTDWYGNTLASYRRFFGEPPADLWPARPVHPKTVRMDVARYWFIPKPRLPALSRFRRGFTHRASTQAAAPAIVPLPGAAPVERQVMLASVGAIMAALPSAAEEWPFNLRGPEFLAVYLGIVAVLVVIAFFLRRKLAGPVEVTDTDSLSPYAVAYLAGGPNRVFVAGLAAVAQRGLVVVSENSVKRTEVPQPDNLPLVERAICSGAGLLGRQLYDVRAATGGAIEAIAAELAEKGLLTTDSGFMKARLVPAGVVAIALLIGGQKVLIGLERGRPVAFLVILMVLTLGIAIALACRPPRLSGRGREALRRLKAKHDHSSLQRWPRASDAGPDVWGSPGTAFWVPLSVGLYGASVLHGTELESVARYGLPRGGDSGSSSSTSGCSTSSDSGGGDSGGGGCGGCGGD